MTYRLLFTSLLVISLVTLGVMTLQAQGPSPRQTPDRNKPPASNSTTVHSQFERPAATATGALGEPGLSFRYLRSFGEVAEPYLADTAHVNRPHGLFIDANNNLFVIEEQGRRVLKYNAAGANVLALGRAGVCYTAEDVFCIPYDVVADADGNLWVADGSRIVQYSPNGAFLQQLPPENAWETGTDNTHFDNVNGIAVSSNGFLFVADSNNQRIQVYNLLDDVLTYSATIGVTGEKGADNTHFNQPYRLTLDPDNRLYVVDRENGRVQRCTLTTTWNCSTFATALNQPQGIATSPDNHIFIADTNHGRLVKCTTAGVCSDFATELEGTYDVAVDSNGNVYGAAAYESYVYKLNSSGQFMGAFVGVRFDPYMTDTYHYNHPRVTLDSNDNLIIVEESGQRLLKLDPTGKPLWAIGEPGVDNGENDHFQWPHGAATDSAGQVYVADTSRVQLFSSDGVYQATLGEGSGDGPLQFGWANGVAVATNGIIYVSDGSNHRVQIFDNKRQYIGTLGVTGESGSDNAHFNLPLDVEVDSTGNIYVADHLNCRVQKFNANRVYQMTFGRPGSCSPALTDVAPEEVAVDSEGRVYVAGWHERVQVFDRTGAYLTTIGGSWGERPGEMRSVNSVALDKAGHVYIGDFDNARIQVFAPGTPGWQQANINGFGDRTNVNIHTVAAFQGQLYAGTYNDAGQGTQLWKTQNGSDWTPAITPGFGITNSIGINHAISFNDQFYVGVRNDTEGAKIYRSSNGTAWNLVATAGFGDPLNAAVYRFAVFNGQLYAGTGIFTTTHGAEIWRSPSGDSGTWSLVVSNGFDSTNNFIMRSSATHNGYLYFGTQNIDTSTNMTTTGGIVIRSPSGDNDSWTKVTLDGFGDINNSVISGLASFNGYLYASTSRWTESGIQVWRCQTCNGPDSWEKVVDNGFGNVANWGLSTLQVFGDRLYVAVGNGVTGLEVWQTESGDRDAWTRVGAEGFGDLHNVSPYYNNLAIFNNHLYLGTQNDVNGGELWMYTEASSGQVTPGEGGGVYNQTHGISLTVPPGAVTSTVDLALNLLKAPNHALSADQVGVRYFTITAADENGSPVTHFNQPYTLTLRYTDEELHEVRADETTLTCLYWDQADNEWDEILPQLDATANQVSCGADHLTEFALASGQSALDYLFLPVVVR